MKLIKKAFTSFKTFIQITKINKELQILLKQLVSSLIFMIVMTTGFIIYTYLLVNYYFENNYIGNSNTMNIILFMLILNGLTIGRISFGDFFESQDKETKKMSYTNYLLILIFIILLFL